MPRVYCTFSSVPIRPVSSERASLTGSLDGHKILVMKKRASAAVANGRSQGTRASKRYAAAEFKAKCLELMDRVRVTGVEYIVTKHGKPVAKLVPYREPARTAFFGSMRGTVLKYERPFDPIDGEYDINHDEGASSGMKPATKP